MKTLYIECNMGAAGDMLMASLLELCEQKDEFIKEINSIGLDGVDVKYEKSKKCGILGTHVRVVVNGVEEESVDVSHHDHDHQHDHDHDHEHDHEHQHHHDHDHEHDHDHKHDHDHDHHHHHEHEHHHASVSYINELINSLKVSDRVKKDAIAVYNIIAKAEAHAHDTEITQIHFHEVGTLDAVADVVGCCMLMDKLSPDNVVVSPINTGSGFVRCAHGVLPVPAPATAFILKGMPILAGTIKGELCTPTGAAILKHFAKEFGRMPLMAVDKIGYGMGCKDFEAANCVRTFLGDVSGTTEQICELYTNIDDMTAEALGYACDILLKNGAKDVYTTAIQMKKNRHAVKLSCICRPEEAKKFSVLMLTHTTTRGVRRCIMDRIALKSEKKKVHTKYGDITIKISSGEGITKQKPEYDDTSKAATEHDVPIETVTQEALKQLY